MNKNEIMSRASKIVGKASFQLKKHSPEILVVAGVAGTVVSAIIACKATLKVNEIVEDVKHDIRIRTKRAIPTRQCMKPCEKSTRRMPVFTDFLT